MSIKRVVKIIASFLVIYVCGYLFYKLYSQFDGMIAIIVITLIMGVLSYFILRTIFFMIWNEEILKYWKTPKYKEKERLSKKIPNRIHGLVINKENWSLSIHNEICLKYLKDKKHTVNMMEKVLFLMQIESLKNINRPFLKYRTYIYNNKIYIKFMSDLFVVKKLGFIDIPRNEHSRDYYDYMHIYKEMLKDYMRDTEQALDQKIKLVLSQEQLNKKYFSLKEYKGKWYRMKARIWYKAEYRLKDSFFYLFTLLMFFLGICYFIQLGYWVIDKFVEISELTNQDIFIETLLFVCFVVPALIYAYKKYNQPTEYEKKHFQR